MTGRWAEASLNTRAFGASAALCTLVCIQGKATKQQEKFVLSGFLYGEETEEG